MIEVKAAENTAENTEIKENAETAENTETDEYHAVIAELQEYMAESGKSQTDISKEIGKSSGLISGFLSGRYKTPHTIIPLIRNVIEAGKKRGISPEPPPYAETGVSRKVRAVITSAHFQGKIAVVHGDAGVGKTMAAKKYCEENANAVMVTATVVHSGVRGITRLLARKLGCKSCGTMDMFDDICEKLQGTGRVIIVDEAQLLTVLAINHLRAITDACGVGIAFIGNEEIYQKMQGRGEEKYAQLFSRIAYKARVTAAGMTKKDIEAVFGGAKLDKEAKDALYNISRSNMGLRGAVNVYVNALINGEEATAGEIAETARDMGIMQKIR
jgi:DNA transposition AAA+ family ATPase